MYLSMNILQSELEKQFSLKASKALFPHRGNLGSAALLTSAQPDPHILYIAESRRLPVRWKFSTHVSLIICGEVSEEYFSQRDVDYICVDDNRFPVVLNAVLDIFRLYQSFDEKLKSYILQKDTTDVLCQEISNFIQIPFIIFDVFLRVHYISPEAQNLLEWEWNPVTGEKMLPTEFINQLNLVYTETAENFVDSAVLLRDDRLPYNLICTMDGHNDYIIVAFETEVPLTRSTLEIIGFLNNYILRAFESSGQKRYVSNSLVAMIQSMLEGTKLSTMEIQNQLAAVNWKRNDNYCCIVVRSMGEWDSRKYVNTFCLKLESIFPSSVVFPYKEQIAAVINLKKSNCPYFDIQRRISILLREGLMKAGVSFKYWDFETTPIYFQQACYAYDMGKLYNNTSWCYSFSEYAIQYFIHYGASRIPPRHLCHPGLVELYQYDLDNGTQLKDTLEVYIENNCNAVTAANLLYIHRNTFYQRLNRIQEMLHLNLENNNERLYLQISIKMIRMYYYELENGFYFPKE